MQMVNTLSPRIDRYRGELLAFAYRLLHDAHGAEDCVQSAFLSAVRSEFPPENLRAWLFRVVHNLAVNALRRDERSPELRGPAAARPVRRVEAQEELECLLAQIPEEYRAILLLRYTHGLTFREIAEVVGRPAGTVKVYAGRALMMLKNLRR